MKKLLALVLSLVMLCALTIPALAAAPEADLDLPLWRIYGYDSYEALVNSYTEYYYMTKEEAEADYAADVAYVLSFIETRPEETAQFRANAYRYFEENYYGAAEEYMSDWGESEEQFVLDMTVWQIFVIQETEQYAAEWAQLCQEQPERTAQFLAELDIWFAEEYYYFESFEEYCEYCACAEQAYIELFEYWNWEYEWAQAQEQERQEFLTAHGGVPGQINVMVNGRCVAFPDAIPEVTNGRTMMPLRPMMEALGVVVIYRGEDVICKMGDVALTFTYGSNEVIVDYTEYVDGGDEFIADIITMDCAPYIKDDRTYVPVRFISEALGYRVDWDEDYNTAVITDVKTLAEEIDGGFTCYNRLMSSQIPTTQSSYLLSGTSDADLTAFNSLDGDETYQFSLAYDLLLSDAGVSGVVGYDFSLLWELFQEYVPMPLEEDQDDDYQQQLALLTTLLSGNIDIRVDVEAQMAYFSLPALRPAAWFSASLEDIDLESLTEQLSNQPSTLGQLICTTILDSYIDPVQYYDSALESADQFALLVGDEKFVQDGSAYVLTLTADDIEAVMPTEDTGVSFSAFSYTLRLEENNDLTVDGLFRIALNSDSLTLDDTLECFVSGSKVGGKTQMTTQFHLRNLFKMIVKQNLTLDPTQNAPVLTPPQGALILDLEKLNSEFAA